MNLSLRPRLTPVLTPVGLATSDCVLYKDRLMKLVSLDMAEVDGATEKLKLLGIFVGDSSLRSFPTRFSASWSGDVDRLRFLFSSLSENKIRLGPRAGTTAFTALGATGGLSTTGLIKRARFDARDDSGIAEDKRFADFGVFFFPGVFFLAEARFLGDFTFGTLP